MVLIRWDGWMRDLRRAGRIVVSKAGDGRRSFYSIPYSRAASEIGISEEFASEKHEVVVALRIVGGPIPRECFGAAPRSHFYVEVFWG